MRIKRFLSSGVPSSITLRKSQRISAIWRAVSAGSKPPEDFLLFASTAWASKLLISRLAAHRDPDGRAARLVQDPDELGRDDVRQLVHEERDRAESGDALVGVFRTDVALEIQESHLGDRRGGVEGPAAYYKVSLYAPYIYGLVQMVLIGLFPVAALWALWPGHWKALLNFGKLFLSVKLWMVFWAILAAFNQARYDLVLGNDPARNGIGNQIEILPSIATMYLLTPLLSYMIVSLATYSGALALQGIIPKASTLSGLQDLHKEAKVYQTDLKGLSDGAQAGAHAALGGSSGTLASGSGASDSSSPFRFGSGESGSAGEVAGGGQAAAM